MKKNTLDKKFVHHKWFSEGITVRYALDLLAKAGFYLDKKRAKAKRGEERLFAPESYSDVLRSNDYRDQSTYRLNEEEKVYFLERAEYWQQEKETKHHEWLNTEIDVDKVLRIYLCGNSYYDVKYAENQRDTWKNKYNDMEMVKVWEGYVAERKQSKAMIDELIRLHKDKIKTNQDFKNFVKLLETEVYDKFTA